MAELEHENCRLCGQEIYEPLLSEYREKKRGLEKTERVLELVEEFINDHIVMNLEDWDDILIEAGKES